MRVAEIMIQSEASCEERNEERLRDQDRIDLTMVARTRQQVNQQSRILSNVPTCMRHFPWLARKYHDTTLGPPVGPSISERPENHAILTLQLEQEPR